MKKYLLLFLLLFIPFMVKAKDGLTVENLEYVEKSELAEVIEDATFQDLSISINLRFHNLNDYVKYKITIKNDTDKDYDLDSEEKLTDYIKMKFDGLEKSDKILKANSTKSFYLIIYYAVPVPKEEFKEGSTLVYEETKTIDFSPKEVNPNTYTLPVIVISILVVSGLTLTFFISKKKALKATMVVLIIATMFLPLRPTALEKITLDVNYKVEIKHPSFFIDFRWPNERKVEFLFEEGMTWREFMDSDYFSDEYNWNIVNYLVVYHYTPNSTGIENITYEYLPDNQEGISVDNFNINCGSVTGNQWIENNQVISEEDGYPSPDSLIKNGYTYAISLGTWC